MASKTLTAKEIKGEVRKRTFQQGATLEHLLDSALMALNPAAGITRQVASRQTGKLFGEALKRVLHVNRPFKNNLKMPVSLRQTVRGEISKAIRRFHDTLMEQRKFGNDMFEPITKIKGVGGTEAFYGTEGFFDPQTRSIGLNPRKIQKDVFPHEMGHALSYFSEKPSVKKLRDAFFDLRDFQMKYTDDIVEKKFGGQVPVDKRMVLYEMNPFELQAREFARPGGLLAMEPGKLVRSGFIKKELDRSMSTAFIQTMQELENLGLLKKAKEEIHRLR